MQCILNYIRRQWIARTLAVFSVCFLIGLCLGAKYRLSLLPVSIAAGLILIANLCLKKRSRYHCLLPMTLAVLLGCTRMLAEIEFNPAVPERFSISFEGTVISEPSYNASSDRIICLFHVQEMDHRPVNYRVRLYLRSDAIELSGIEYGQRLECMGHIWPQDHATNPHEYDAMNALRADGLDGMAAAKLEDVTILSSRSGFESFRITIRHAISDRIDLLFADNADLVRAFVLGDRTGLDQQTRDAFSQTGVSHLICISGLHISIVAVAVSKLLALRFTRKQSSIATMTVVLLYGLLIGFSASLVRATVMFAIYAFVPITGRPSDPITRLSFALLCMLFCKPFYIFDIGFILSFSASAGILLLTQPLESLFHVENLRHIKPHPRRIIRLLHRIVRYFPLLLCTTLAAQLATLPAVIAAFGNQPLISVPVNLIAVPIAMLAYPLALVALAASVLLSPLGQLIAQISDAMFTGLIALIDLFAALPVAVIRTSAYPVWLIVLHCLIILLASGLNRIPVSIRRFLPLGLVVLIGVSSLNAYLHTLGFTAIFLDADQADAAVIKAEGHVYVCDTGDLYSPVTDYLTGSCLNVDAVFLSHPHQDHAAGLTELLDSFRPKAVYVPEGWFAFDADESVSAAISAVRACGIPIIELAGGDELYPSENVCIRIHEPSRQSKSANDLSMLMEIRYFDRSLFFTGDLSAEGEPESMPDTDILKVPHHGSGKATSSHLLKETSPEVAIISVGENNYGHPSSETLERLNNAGAEVYRTDECGAIEIRISRSGDIRIKTYFPMEESK